MAKPWESIDAYLKAKGVRIGAPTDGQTDGGIHNPGSVHKLGRARDYGNGVPYSDCPAVATALKPYATKDGPIMELFYEGTNVKVWRDNGVDFTPKAGLRNQHKDHVHVALWPGRVMPTIEPARVPAAPQTSKTTEAQDMAQCIWHDGAVAVLDPAGNVYCPAVPNKPVAKHYGGMADLAPQYKQAFSGRATFIVPIDAGNSQAGYTIGDSSWGPDFYTFDPGVKKFFR